MIGAVAVPAVGHELSIARREEVGLARLRGVHGARMVVFLLAEPLLAVLTGAVAGLALGLAGTWLTTRWWLAEPGVGASAYSLAAAGAGGRRGHGARCRPACSRPAASRCPTR